MKLKELRQENNKTLAEVASAMGVSVSAVSNYEKGIRTIGIEQVLILSKLYDCSAEEVITAQLNSVKEQGEKN